ncbi:MAG: hypothetical protein IJX86_02560 [Lachnospiraceae bacterium]|nr:hypothetical protein [Lachnospiraceae bacterium]
MKNIAGKIANIILIIIGSLSFFMLISKDAYAAEKVTIATAKITVEQLTKGNAKEQITEAYEEALDNAVDILVLPYMDVSGLQLTDTALGYAKESGMWILFAANESEYESVFVCAPTGEVMTYQGMHPYEASAQGKSPLMIETEYGTFGIAYGDDLYYVPELPRYYAVRGCRMILNPVLYQTELTAETEYLIESREEIPVLFSGGSKDQGVTLKVKSYSEDIIVSHDVTATYVFKPAYYASWYEEVIEYQKEQVNTPMPDYEAPTISVVDYKAVWGDLDANLKQMLEYIDEAHEKKSDILVFPEMALQGYCMADDKTSKIYRLAVDKAITRDGYYAGVISEKAKEYNMYIIFGASEVIPEAERKSNQDKAYNSAFVCTPDGSVTSYRKIHQVEGRWCRYASQPLIVDTEYGPMGIAICKDTYAYPEMARYYAGMGCIYYVNVSASASGGDDWKHYYSSRLENIAIANRMIVISANLTGNQYDTNGELRGWYAGRGCVLGPQAPYYFTDSVDDMGLEVGIKTVVIEPEYLKTLKRDKEVTYNPSLYMEMYNALAGKTDTTDKDDGDEENDTVDPVETETEQHKVTYSVNKVNEPEAADKIKTLLFAHQEYVTHYTYRVTAMDEDITDEQGSSYIPMKGKNKKHTLFSEFMVIYDDGVDIRPVYSSTTRTSYRFTVMGKGTYYVVEYCNIYDKNHNMLSLLKR